MENSGCVLKDNYEVLVAVHVITERNGGSVYRTEFLEERWVPMSKRGHTVGDEQYVTLYNRPSSETFRRKP